ncbi:MAG: ABC transporter permease [Erysipelotrichaceae bacterium]|nr:ABC transporter permease [Erysipelotrichaceae bacterium]
MRTMFYPRLAWDGLRKNRRLVFPYMLTCICMIAMFYILAFLASPEITDLLPIGTMTTAEIMTLGSYVIAVFSIIFLYYTNSFLIRRRAREFGLYNVLGMNKGNLARIMTFESLITSAVSLFLGLFLGIVLSKLAELGLMRIIGGTITYSLHIDMGCVVNTVLFYLEIFTVIWLSSIIRVSCSTAVSLLNSEKTGEKAPKANWLLGILGVMILVTAYYIAVTIKSPLEALILFFLAVIMVIVATYLLMISGSVLLCRMLQKNRKYYYEPNHFVSVSSLVYRMKRNGAGLASIAIISTMVLVMISSASCLWFGTKDVVNSLYHGDVNLTVRFYDRKLIDEDNLDAFRKVIDDFKIENRSETEMAFELPFIEAEGVAEGKTIDFGDFDESMMLTKIREVSFIPLSFYNEVTGHNITLNEGEALVSSSGTAVNYDHLELILNGNVKNYRIIDSIDKKFVSGINARDIIPKINLVVDDISAIAMFFENSQDDPTPMNLIWRYSFDVKQSSMSKTDYAERVADAIYDVMEKDPGTAGLYSVISEERESESVYLISSNGSLFFIGLMLSIVFIFATVLIIYYKQISEGYEDVGRFEIMRKVGMTREEIKKNINSQLLVVFFIPLAFAGMHLAFAFPMIGKLLAIFGLHNKGLFIFTTLISYVLFASFYTMVYKVTSNVYYNIVSEAK